MANIPTIIDRTFSNFNPARRIEKMQRRMDQLFNSMLNDVSEDQLDLAFSPACSVDETDNHYLMSFDVPGVKKDDIKIELRGNTLSVSGERKEEFEQKNKSQYKSESSYGIFQRSFDLAEDVKADQIEAQFENGVLKVAIPKTKASKAEQIKISEGKGGLWGKIVGQKKDESISQH